MKTVVGLFDTYAHAETAALDLENAGISHNDISLVANNTSGQLGQPVPATATYYPNVASETATGAVEGGIAGLLLGLAAFAIPGLGPIAVAGWLTTMLTGVVVGAGVGLVGALMGAGVPKEEAAYYAEGIRRGGTLLAVRTSDEQAQRVAQILSSDGAVDIDERAEQYRQDGYVPPEPAPVNTTTTMASSTGANTTPMNREAEPLSGVHASRTTGYDAYEADFRNHWRTNYGNQGGTYDDYAAAYEYGYESGNDPRYRGRDWNSVQSDLQRDWETRQPGTWDRIRISARYAWDKATGAERGGIEIESSTPTPLPPA